jgi:hypothetical protein
LRTAEIRIRPSIPVSRRASAGDAVEVLLVAQPDELGMVGRCRELDVDRAPAGAGAQVLVHDVAIVPPGADHARGQVVGAQEVEEAVIPEAAVLAEHAVRQRQAVAGGDPLHELGRRRSLEVDMELGLG